MTTSSFTEILTSDGRRVNPHSGLCESCSSALAQTTVFWTDDAEFPEPEWKAEQRFAHIQREATNRRRKCLERCGRQETT